MRWRSECGATAFALTAGNVLFSKTLAQYLVLQEFLLVVRARAVAPSGRHRIPRPSAEATKFVT